MILTISISTAIKICTSFICGFFKLVYCRWVVVEHQFNFVNYFLLWEHILVGQPIYLSCRSKSTTKLSAHSFDDPDQSVVWRWQFSSNCFAYFDLGVNTLIFSMWLGCRRPKFKLFWQYYHMTRYSFIFSLQPSLEYQPNPDTEKGYLAGINVLCKAYGAVGGRIPYAENSVPHLGMHNPGHANSKYLTI